MTAKTSITRLFLLYFMPSILWAIVIFHASSYPTATVTKVYWEEFLIKKLAHVFVYSIFTLLNYRAFLKSGLSKQASGISSIIITFLYGISDEIHQGFTPSREPALRDAIIDTVAGIAIIGFIWKFSQKMPKSLLSLVRNLELL